MKIISRPPVNVADNILGNGEYPIALTSEQLDLMISFLYQVRLGSGTTYGKAAFDLMCLLSEEIGDDGFQEAAERVDLGFTIEDSGGDIELSSKSGDFFLNLEV